MDALVYPRERTLGTITLVLGSIAWLLIVVGTLGIVLIYLAVGLHRLPVRPIRADFTHQEHRGAPDTAAVSRFARASSIAARTSRSRRRPKLTCWQATASSTRS